MYIVDLLKIIEQILRISNFIIGYKIVFGVPPQLVVAYSFRDAGKATINDLNQIKSTYPIVFVQLANF